MVSQLSADAIVIEHQVSDSHRRGDFGTQHLVGRRLKTLMPVTIYVPLVSFGRVAKSPRVSMKATRAFRTSGRARGPGRTTVGRPPDDYAAAGVVLVATGLQVFQGVAEQL